jgi:hypothetical protein
MITKVDTAYPSQYETEAILRDGSIVQLRPIRVEDVPQIAELDLNPVKVMPRGRGCWVIDTRILLG